MGRIRSCFDNDWIFKNEEIEIPYAIKAGRTGMPTDGPDTMEGLWLAIAYDDGPASEWSFDDWEKVTLPHDWAVYKEYDQNAWHMGGYISPGVGCYRKTFRIPGEYEGKKVTIDFDGVARNCTLWLNGFLIGSHFSAYTPFSFDLSDFLRYGDEGENVLFMKVDARSPEGWWYEGAGIYRHVYLTVTEPVHFKKYGVFVRTENVTEEHADVIVETDVLNEDTQAMKVRLKTAVYDENDRLIASGEEVVCTDGLEEKKTVQKLCIEHPKLWDVESPGLYRLESELWIGEEEIDRVTDTFGVRTVVFTPEGCYLNGRKIILKGICNHQDFGGVGTALPDSIHEYKIMRLKEMGANAYRCAHHPPAVELLDACDRLGMMVMDENRKLDTSPDGIRNLETMVLRDRNRPSVILWCMENEEVLLGQKSARRIEGHMRQIVKKLDPTRLTVSAMNHGWNDNGYEECTDIVGYNYGHINDRYFHDAVDYPDRLMLITETTASYTTRGVYRAEEEKGHYSCFETEVEGFCTIAKKSWKDLLAWPRLTGIFAWCGFDYRGEPIPKDWPCINSHWGIMDMCGLAKDIFYYYQAVWKKEPVIHLFPHWNHNEGEEVPVRVFTNCDSYELVLNGRSLGERKVDDINDYQDQTVTFEAGSLTAIGKKAGKEVCRKTVTTAGSAARILLVPHKPDLKNDGEDAVVVHVGILDRNGVPVPDAANRISFRVSAGAKIIGVCNGDPSCHEPDKAAQRSAFHGWCAVIVQSVRDGEKAVLTADSPGLETGSYEFEQ